MKVRIYAEGDSNTDLVNGSLIVVEDEQGNPIQNLTSLTINILPAHLANVVTANGEFFLGLPFSINANFQVSENHLRTLATEQGFKLVRVKERRIRQKPRAQPQQKEPTV